MSEDAQASDWTAVEYTPRTVCSDTFSEAVNGACVIHGGDACLIVTTGEKGEHVPGTDCEEVPCEDDRCPIDHWNYRVLNRSADLPFPFPEAIEEWLLIECYYDADGTVVAWGEAPPMVSDCSLADLYGESMRRSLAIDKVMSGKLGMLTPDDLPQEPDNSPESFGSPSIQSEQKRNGGGGS